MKYMLIFLACANLLSLVLMAVDKSKAMRHRWRIPEKVLFAAAILGGGLGAVAGMILLNHKTKHMSFRIGLPLILVVQIVLFIIWA